MMEEEDEGDFGTVLAMSFAVEEGNGLADLLGDMKYLVESVSVVCVSK